MATSKAILGRHLERGGEAGQVDDGARFNLFDVRYPLREGLRVAIVIPTKNHGDLVRQCVDSIRATAGSVAYDIVVIDHESDDPETIAYLASIDGEVTVLRYSGPFNFSAINNWAIQRLTGPYTHYLLCNNDIEAIHPGWLERMLELGQHEDVGIVGAQLLYPDRVTIQHAGVCVGAFGAAEHYAKFIRVPDVPLYLGFSEILASNHEVSAVTAACLLIRQDAFAAVHGFDEALAVGFGDVNLCLRVGQLGYRVALLSARRAAAPRILHPGQDNGQRPASRGLGLVPGPLAGIPACRRSILQSGAEPEQYRLADAAADAVRFRGETPGIPARRGQRPSHADEQRVTAFLAAVSCGEERWHVRATLGIMTKR